MSAESLVGKWKEPFGAEQIARLERLSNAVGVSGNEQEVRAIVLETVRPLVDSVDVDALGNVLAIRHAARAGAPRVMLAAHMDEVGMMLVSADEGSAGLFSFQTVGGIDVRQLPGKAVWAGKEHTPGVIGAKPIHLTERDELGRSIPMESLRVDVGPAPKDAVKVGDWATFATNFQVLDESFCGKALDDRLGVSVLLELLASAPRNVELLAAFTVQEEIGARGARVAAYALKPDMAIVLESTPANDLPVWDGSENLRYNARLGAGPAIYVADALTLSDPRLVAHLRATAEREGIPYQVRQPGGGGTDAGVIHRQREGIPSVSVSVPARYAHSARLMARRSDWENTYRLVGAALESLPADLLSAS